MSFNISYVYQAINKFSPATKAMKKDNDALNKSIKLSAVASRAASRAQQILKRAVASTGSAMRKATSEARAMAGELRKSNNVLGDVIGKMTEVAATAAIVIFPTKHAMAFEDAISNATKKMDDAGKGTKTFERIKKEVLELASASNKTAVEIAGIYSAGASGGFSDKKLKAFADLTLRASTAFDMATEETGDALTKISGQMNIPISEMTAVADTVNHLADSLANVKANELLNVVGRAAGNLAALKITGEQSAGFAAFALQMTGSTEVAGTSLRNLLGDVRKIGQSSPSINLALKNNPTKAIQDIINKIKGMSKDAQFDFITKNFREDSAQLMLKAVANTDKLSKAIETASNKTKIAGSLQREFDAVMNRSSSTMTVNITKMKEISIVIGTAMLPVVDALFSSLGYVAEALMFLSPLLEVLAPILAVLVIAIVATKAAMLAASVSMYLFGSGTVAAKIALFALKAALLVAKGAMIAFNIVANMNPLGLVVIAVTALSAAIYLAYQHFESFRDIVDSAWASVKGFFGGDEEKTVTMNIKKNSSAVSEAAGASPINGAANSSSNAITANVNSRTAIDLNIRDKGNNVEKVSDYTKYSAMNTYKVMG